MFHLPWMRLESTPRPAPAAWYEGEELLADPIRIRTMLQSLAAQHQAVTLFGCFRPLRADSALLPSARPDEPLTLCHPANELGGLLDQPLNVITRTRQVELMFTSRLDTRTDGTLNLRWPGEMLYMELRHEFRVGARQGDRVLLGFSGATHRPAFALEDLSEGGLCLRFSATERAELLRQGSPARAELHLGNDHMPLGPLELRHISKPGARPRAGYRFIKLPAGTTRRLATLLLQRQAQDISPTS